MQEETQDASRPRVISVTPTHDAAAVAAVSELRVRFFPPWHPKCCWLSTAPDGNDDSQRCLVVIEPRNLSRIRFNLCLETMTASDPAQLDLSGARILVVDDVLENRKVLCQLLGDAGYDVYSVPDGETALASAQADPPDLILLDVSMPGLDGYHTCRLLKQDERTRQIQVVFITAHHEIQNLVEGFRAGGVDYLTKPVQT